MAQPEEMRLDAHQHFWRYDPQQYPWIQPNWPIQRDFLPADLEPWLTECAIDGSIAVQARQTLEESRWLLSLAAQSPRIAGVVGWVDLRSPRLAEQLTELATDPKFLGVRHVVQDEPDDRFLLQPDVVAGIRQLKSFQLTYDLLVFPKQLPAAIQLVRLLPDQPFVLDHIAKPLIRKKLLDPWGEHIRQLAQGPNVTCKISGLVTEADWQQWTEEELRPYLDVVFEAFGPERVMFGSDWPVCLLAGAYSRVFELVDGYARQFSTKDRDLLFGGNCARVYGVKPLSRNW